MMATKVDGLTKLQANFVDEFFVDYNITNAYIRAGYKVDGSKRSSINRMAFEVYNNPNVKEAIKERLDEVRQDRDMILQKLVAKAIEIIDNPESKSSDVIKAMEYLGKLYGVADNLNVQGSGELSFNIQVESAE